MFMSLLDSIEKMINKTSNFMNSFKVSIPTGKVGEFLGVDDIEINGIGDIGNAVQEAGGAVSLGFNLLNCGLMGSTWAGMLESILFNLSTAVLDIAETIMSAIAAQLRAAFNQILSTLFSLVTSIMSLIKTIFALWDAIKGLASWLDVSLGKFVNILNREQCVDLYSSIAACLLNKFLGPLLDEFESDALNAVNKVGNKFNDFISEQMEDVDVLTSYIDRENFFIQKAKIQIEGLSPENVLRY